MMNSLFPPSGNADNAAPNSDSVAVATTEPMVAAHIDLSAIEHNVRYLRSLAPQAELMAVIKADGYGHGAIQSARAALRGGARAIGVATISEAQQLRATGITEPILAWLLGAQENFGAAILADITVALSSSAQLKAIIAAAQLVGKTASIEIKIDTGLRRNGISQDDWHDFQSAIARAVIDEAVEVRGTFTHLSHADHWQHPMTNDQLRILQECAHSLQKMGVDPGIVHCANTAALLSRPDTHLDRVRPGIGIYGYSPVGGNFSLIPALTLQAEIIAIRRAYVGDGVSYSHRWMVEKPGYLALVPMGYADGLSRSLGGKIIVTIKGRQYPQVGTICMDQCVIDIGENADNITVGDKVTFLSDGGDGSMTVDDWARISGTINYEIITFLRGRTRRVYHDSSMV